MDKAFRPRIPVTGQEDRQVEENSHAARRLILRTLLNSSSSPSGTDLDKASW